MIQTKSIALIDDEESIHTIFKLRFKKEINSGLIDLHSFFDGKQFYDFLKENNALNFSIILSDINMPIMDGFALLELVKEEYPSLEFCFCSAYGGDDYKQRARDLGASDYLVKPVSIKVMKDWVYKKLEIKAS